MLYYKNMHNVPTGLRIWFKIHFVVDYLFAIPLFFAPDFVLRLFFFETTGTLTEVLLARIVAAALFAIGGISLLTAKEDAPIFITLLNLKLVWSFTALSGMLLSFSKQEAAPTPLWILFALFAIFAAVWAYYRRILGKSG